MLISCSPLKKSKLPRSSAIVPIEEIGGARVMATRGRTIITVSFRVDLNVSAEVDVLIRPTLSNYRSSAHMLLQDWSHLRGLELINGYLTHYGPVEIVLGSDIYGSLISDGIKRGSPDLHSLGLPSSGGFSLIRLLQLHQGHL